jgi:ABC-type transport system substrate-binding protein
MHRHRVSFLVALLVGLLLSSAHAQDQKPPPTGSEGAFVYVAPSFIKELDSKFPAQPPVPPSPPRYGGVLQFPAPAISSFDPTVGYRPDLASAGFPNGFDLEIEWAEFQGWTYSEYAQLLARFFSEVGVRAKLKQLETSTWIAKVQGAQPFGQALATASPIGAGPSFMDWVYLRYHSSLPKTMNREGINDPKLDDLLTKWRQDPGDKRPAIQKAIGDHLREHVYRITTIVPPHYRVTQS